MRIVSSGKNHRTGCCQPSFLIRLWNKGERTKNRIRLIKNIYEAYCFCSSRRGRLSEYFLIVNLIAKKTEPG
ncbi:LOW QUALITY PROTEIN: hypothetical protein HZS_3712 [Henneguya salminicola]|nr:LOW QUALITY PROTEIN: hypothetical protein HZS_3712 [Henneguya salminicola]